MIDDPRGGKLTQGERLAWVGVVIAGCTVLAAVGEVVLRAFKGLFCAP
jgi:hypothetical protein